MALLGVVLVLMASLFGCGRRPGDGEAQQGKLLADTAASVGGKQISMEAFERAWRRRGGTRSKDEVLREMVRFEATLAKARAAGLDRDPELMAAVERLVVSKFEESQLQRLGGGEIQISDAEMRSYYDTHGERFSSPAKIRLGIIVREASAKAAPERRAVLRQEAEALWREASRSAEVGFRSLAVEHSEDQSTR